MSLKISYIPIKKVMILYFLLLGKELGDSKPKSKEYWLRKHDVQLAMS